MATAYYSGTQAQIYFKDIFVDEISAIQVAVNSNRAPVYGYASQLFDAVLDGNLLISGMFSVNFIIANYIPIILEAAVKPPEAVAKARESEEKIKELQSLVAGKRGDRLLRAIAALPNDDIRALVAAAAAAAASEQEAKRPTWKDLAGQPDVRVDRLPPFDIYAVFGNYHMGAPHTVKKIRDVYLTNSSIRVTSNGDPIQEVYEFIARDIG